MKKSPSLEKEKIEVFPKSKANIFYLCANSGKLRDVIDFSACM